MSELEDNKKEVNKDETQVQAIKTTEFMKETIKQRPINRKRLARRLIATVAMAVLFGLIACFTFLILEPIIDKRYDKEVSAPVENITFPEETKEEETLPEDMIAEEVELMPIELEKVPLGDNQIEQVLNEMQLGQDEYLSLSQVVIDTMDTVSKSVVTVVGITKDTDWFSNEYDYEDVISGVIIADNGPYFLILADLGEFTSVDTLEVVFCDGKSNKATQIQHDNATGLSILAVAKSEMKMTTIENIKVIEIGSTLNKKLNGVPVIAVGRTLGIDNSVGVGVITSYSSMINLVDGNYKLLTTSINGSSQGSGILVNVEGQLLGIISMSNTLPGMENVITGIGISDIKSLIEKMSNDNEVPYLGVYGTDVTSAIMEQLGVPMGIYVTKLEMDSPLMEAGIKSGDIITKFNGTSVITFKDMNSIRLTLNPEDNVTIEIKRQGTNDYTSMEYEVTLAHQN